MSTANIMTSLKRLMWFSSKFKGATIWFLWWWWGGGGGAPQNGVHKSEFRTNKSIGKMSVETEHELMKVELSTSNQEFLESNPTGARCPWTVYSPKQSDLRLATVGEITNAPTSPEKPAFASF